MLSDFLSSLLPQVWAEEKQEAPAEDKEEETPKEDGGEEAAEEAPAEEEEEEEEPEDEAPAIKEECAESSKCAPLKHHFDHCQEKVQEGKGQKGEDCVEELFHLMHCVDTCAAPKIFAKLR